MASSSKRDLRLCPTRRAATAGLLAATLGGQALAADGLGARCAAIEARLGGRIGVVALQPSTGRRAGWRPHERFPMCSTFKLLAAADVLSRVDAGRERLDRNVPYGEKDLLDYAPVTRAHVKEGAMTLGALCAAMVELSDNTAANLVLAGIGGPQGYTRFVRRIGDGFTRLDRTEPELNSALPGDPRDTTTPEAMAGSLERVLLGPVLSPASRALLVHWLKEGKVGAQRLRSGLPAGWTAGDKPGTGAKGSTNDIGILWPPGGGPILATAYFTGSEAPLEAREAALAEVGRAIAAWSAA